MTDARAELREKVARAVWNEGVDAAIAVALEEAARVAERYVIDEKELHPDVPFDQINLSYKTAVHAGAQYIAASIRALIPKEKPND